MNVMRAIYAKRNKEKKLLGSIGHYWQYIPSPGGQNATQQKVNFSGEAKNYFPS